MTELMEQAIEILRSLPAERQDEYARSVMQLAGKDLPAIALTPEEETDLAEAEAEIERGDFAADEDVRAIWAKHDL